MSIIDQEIESLWAVFQLARRELQPDASCLLLKVSLLYLHVRGLQSNIRLLNDKRREITPIDLDRETERTWSVLRLGYKYGNPSLEADLFKKSLQQIFFKGLHDKGPTVLGMTLLLAACTSDSGYGGGDNSGGGNSVGCEGSYCNSGGYCCPPGYVGCENSCYSSTGAAYTATGNASCQQVTTRCPN